MTFKNTGIMCLISLVDESREDGIRHVDLGNFYTDHNNDRVLVTSKENAKRYYSYVNVPIYTFKENI